MKILTVEQAYKADREAIEAGTPQEALMQAAGAAVAEEIISRFSPRAVLAVAGPGNNGGDARIAASELEKKGWKVTVAGPGGLPRPGEFGLVIDGAFGIGLKKPVSPELAAFFAAIKCPVVAVDIPSGIAADSGEILGSAPKAVLTVAFTAKKPGHLLFPGREYCGETVVRGIGIGVEGAGIFENGPRLWRLPEPGISSHKYDRGHAVVAGGRADSTGAARLAGLAALRAGAGLVTIASPKEALPIYAASLMAVMAKAPDDFGEFIKDPHKNAVLIGPGNGVGKETAERVKLADSLGKALVVDADGISSLPPGAVFSGKAVLTPHEGEFARVFKFQGSKLQRAVSAAKASNAVIALKGADTVIASPCGKAAINADAPPWLATAGTGDVLAGIITGLLAQGMEPWEAASAGVWLHGKAALLAGKGMIAEDLLSHIAGAMW